MNQVTMRFYRYLATKKNGVFEVVQIMAPNSEIAKEKMTQHVNNKKFESFKGVSNEKIDR